MTELLNSVKHNKINVLHLGVKYWPYKAGLTSKYLSGIRGGGMVKYNDILLSQLSSSRHNHILFVQQLEGQSAVQILGNCEVHRTRTFGGRALRQILANLFGFLKALFYVPFHKVDIIHGHLQVGILCARILGYIYRKPVIGTPYSFTTSELSWYLRGLAIFIEKKIYPYIDKIIFETQENYYRACIARKTKYDNHTIINTGIKIPKREQCSTDGNRCIRLLFVGRIVKIKALHKLVAAIGLLPEEVKTQIRLDIVGEGEELTKLISASTQAGLSEYIKFRGFVQDTEYYFSQADIFLLISEMEGLSVALLEAMSFGIACIVNDFGLPFPKNSLVTLLGNDPKIIADAIEKLTINRDLIKQYGYIAQETIARQYSIEKFAMQYADLYASLTDKRK